jgi:hypothetical protein
MNRSFLDGGARWSSPSASGGRSGGRKQDQTASESAAAEAKDYQEPNQKQEYNHSTLERPTSPRKRNEPTLANPDRRGHEHPGAENAEEAARLNVLPRA